MSTGYSWEGIRQVRATLLGARHVPERLCGGRVYLGRYIKCSTFFTFLHTRCEMRHFYTLRCPAPFWLIQCKRYRNQFIIGTVIDKSLGARFLWPTVYIAPIS